jgi:hypothetical protein
MGWTERHTARTFSNARMAADHPYIGGHLPAEDFVSLNKAAEGNGEHLARCANPSVARFALKKLAELVPHGSLGASMSDPVRSGAAIRQPLEQEDSFPPGRGREISRPASSCCNGGVAVDRTAGAFEPVLSCEPDWDPRPHRPLLADHAPQYARCARRPLPAMARSRSSSPAAKRRHSSRGNKIAQPAILR